MRVLLDTNVLYRWFYESDRLSPHAIRLVQGAGQVFVSSVSLWEIAIKAGLMRKDFQVDSRLFRRGLLNNNYSPLGECQTDSPIGGTPVRFPPAAALRRMVQPLTLTCDT